MKRPRTDGFMCLALAAWLAVAGLIWVAVFAGLVWAAFHFILKFW